MGKGGGGAAGGRPRAPPRGTWPPPPRLRTQPLTPCRPARRQTNGRNPTPWTTPRTSTDRADIEGRDGAFALAISSAIVRALRVAGLGRSTLGGKGDRPRRNQRHGPAS